MKGKGSASLYEVLKSASRPGSDPSPAAVAAETPPAANDAQKTLQERLAEYKARKLAAAQTPSFTSSPVAVAEPETAAVAVADPTPPPAAVPAAIQAHLGPVLASPSTRSLTPLAPSSPSTPTSSAPPLEGLGERVLRVTWNTAAFGALVVVGLLFVAYALGVKVGRARAEAASDLASGAPPAAKAFAMPLAPAPAPASVVPPKTYTIHLAEWPLRTSQEKLKALDQADRCKTALDRAGFKNVETVNIMRHGEERLALYVERFTDLGASPAKSRLASAQKVKVVLNPRSGQQEYPFEKAGFEEVPKAR